MGYLRAMPNLIFDEAWGAEVEGLVQAKMEELRIWAEAVENAEDAAELSEIEEVETPSGAVYCACEICDTREIMYLSMLLALEGHKAGLVELE